jgi:phosphotransferase system enzyme I (PtsI)
MKIITGKSVVEGIAIGTISVYKSKVNGVVKYVVEDTEREINRFMESINIAITWYDELYHKALLEVGEENAIIFDIYKVILKDEIFIEQIINVIKHEKVNVEYALSVSFDYLFEKFIKMNDTYISERIIDIKDIYQRLMFILKDYRNESTLTNPVIVLADELTPSDLIQFDKTKVLAFASAKGSLNSHVAILAKIMNIPSIIHVDFASLSELDGITGIIDGYEGKLYFGCRL